MASYTQVEIVRYAIAPGDSGACCRTDWPSPGASAKRTDFGHGWQEHREAVALLHLGQDLAGVRRAAVEHGGDHPEHAQLLVGELAHVLDRLEQLADAAVAERLALQRHDHRLRRRQAVDGEHPQRRWAVDQHGVVAVQDRFQRPGEDVLAAGAAQEVHLGAGQVDGGRHEVQARARRGRP